MKKLCVVGSLNVDLTVTIPRFHKPGETITGTGFATYTGGKGGNQAVAAARLGADVTMVACVGDDGNGRMYLDTLKNEGVNTEGVKTVPGVPTGVALIEVDAKGENRIAIVPGANAEATTDVIDEMKPVLLRSDIALFQLETPIPTVNHAMAQIRRAGGIVILDPAPAQPLSDALLILCDYVTPNETELSILTGMPVGSVEEAVKAAATLLARGAKAVINKRGGEGALLVTKDGYKLFEGFKVNVVDTTAAGDSFNAGLAVGLSMDLEIADAIRLANAVGALSTTAMGAQAAMPDLARAMALAEGEYDA